jgi:integrase
MPPALTEKSLLAVLDEAYIRVENMTFSAPNPGLPAPPSPVENHQLTADQLRSASRSKGTIRVYTSGWSQWSAWAFENGRPDLPAAPADVADHLAELSRSAKASTCNVRLAAIVHRHRTDDAPFDAGAEILRATLRGIARTIGTAKKGKDALQLEDVKAMLERIPTDTLKGKRDRALILIGFAGAFRRSELVALDLEHLDWARDGVILTIVRSKTDQTAAGRLVAIAWGKNPKTCPVRALKAWLEAAGIAFGPLFRPVEAGVCIPRRYYDRGVANCIKRWARKAGIDPAKVAGHSLRSGHVTQAASAGAADRDIMNQTGHRRIETMAGYVRRGTLFKNNSSALLGL